MRRFQGNAALVVCFFTNNYNKLEKIKLSSLWRTLPTLDPNLREQNSTFYIMSTD
jgi:hypothetical protein